MELRRETSPLARWALLGLGLCAGIGVVLVRQFHAVLIHLARCPMRAATGIPCPTCGSTHAAVALAQGHVKRSMLINPGMTCTMILFAGAVVWAAGAVVIPSWRVTLVLSRRDKRNARWLAVLVLLGSWLYEIWRLV